MMDVKFVRALMTGILQFSVAVGVLFPAKVNPILKQASDGKNERELTDRRVQIRMHTSDWLAMTAPLDVMDVTLESHPNIIGPGVIYCLRVNK